MTFKHRKQATAARCEAWEQGLMSWTQIAERWHQISGQKLTRQRVSQICRAAERKLAKAMRAGLSTPLNSSEKRGAIKEAKYG